MKRTRDIIKLKFDQVSAHILEFIEEYIKYTPEELEVLKKGIHKNRNESNIKPDFTLRERTADLRFGIFGNVAGKGYHHKPVDFLNLGIMCRIPR